MWSKCIITGCTSVWVVVSIYHVNNIHINRRMCTLLNIQVGLYISRYTMRGSNVFCVCVCIWVFELFPVKFRLWNGFCVWEHVLYEQLITLTYDIKSSSKVERSKAHITAHEPNPLNVERAQFAHTQTHSTFSFLHTPSLFFTWKMAFVFLMCPSPNPFSFDGCLTFHGGGSKECTACEIIIEHLLNWFLLPIENPQKRKLENEKRKSNSSITSYFEWVAYKISKAEN